MFACFFFFLILSARRIKDASPQLRLTNVCLPPRAGGRVIGKNGRARRSLKAWILTTRTGDPRMTKSLFGGSAVIATALLTATTLVYAPPSAAEPVLASQEHSQPERLAQE